MTKTKWQHVDGPYWNFFVRYLDGGMNDLVDMNDIATHKFLKVLNLLLYDDGYFQYVMDHDTTYEIIVKVRDGNHKEC